MGVEADRVPVSRRFCNTGFKDMENPRLFCFGLGYCAGVLADALKAEGWEVTGTVRDRVRENGTFPFDGKKPLAGAAAALKGVSHILVSIPPDAQGDPVLRFHGDDIADLPNLKWLGYLSTTGVYGDTGGKTVDETAPLNPTSERGRLRLEAERDWLALCKDRGVPVHVFRLPGIYGPGRSVFDKLRKDEAPRIDKPGHRFNRIHVDDIAAVLRASMAAPRPGAVYNVCDDEPAPPADVLAYACGLLGRETPPLVPFDEAARDMSPMALSFWRDDRLVSNRKIKEDLGVKLTYPDYRSGLRGILGLEARSFPTSPPGSG